MRDKQSHGSYTIDSCLQENLSYRNCGEQRDLVAKPQGELIAQKRMLARGFTLWRSRKVSLSHKKECW
ncbi:MAG: hypothetical protein ACERKN_03805, partial [Velocimicrobium sp.]